MNHIRMVADFAMAQEVHLATVVEILQSIKQSDMSPLLNRIYGSEGGIELLDVLMKYLYVRRRIRSTHIPFALFILKPLCDMLILD